eukprot:1152094-Rhodomonas_salina.2
MVLRASVSSTPVTMAYIVSSRAGSGVFVIQLTSNARFTAKAAASRLRLCMIEYCGPCRVYATSARASSRILTSCVSFSWRLARMVDHSACTHPRDTVSDLCACAWAIGNRARSTCIRACRWPKTLCIMGRSSLFALFSCAFTCSVVFISTLATTAISSVAMRTLGGLAVLVGGGARA